jgi:regulator of replication initiation timing
MDKRQNLRRDIEAIINQLEKSCRAFLVITQLKKLVYQILEENQKLKEENRNLQSRIAELERRIEELKKEKNGYISDDKVGKKIRFLFAKYEEMWKGAPPEKYKSASYRGMLGKLFKKALSIFENNPDKTWQEYERFVYTFKLWKEGRIWDKSLNKIFYDGSFSNFVRSLPLWVQYTQQKGEEGKRSVWEEL